MYRLFFIRILICFTFVIHTEDVVYIHILISCVNQLQDGITLTDSVIDNSSTPVLRIIIFPLVSPSPLVTCHFLFFSHTET